MQSFPKEYIALESMKKSVVWTSEWLELPDRFGTRQCILNGLGNLW